MITKKTDYQRDYDLGILDWTVELDAARDAARDACDAVVRGHGDDHAMMIRIASEACTRYLSLRVLHLGGYGTRHAAKAASDKRDARIAAQA